MMTFRTNQEHTKESLTTTTIYNEANDCGRYNYGIALDPVTELTLISNLLNATSVYVDLNMFDLNTEASVSNFKANNASVSYLLVESTDNTYVIIISGTPVLTESTPNYAKCVYPQSNDIVSFNEGCATNNIEVEVVAPVVFTTELKDISVNPFVGCTTVVTKEKQTTLDTTVSVEVEEVIEDDNFETDSLNPFAMTLSVKTETTSTIIGNNNPSTLQELNDEYREYLNTITCAVNNEVIQTKTIKTRQVIAVDDIHIRDISKKHIASLEVDGTIIEIGTYTTRAEANEAIDKYNKALSGTANAKVESNYTFDVVIATPTVSVELVEATTNTVDTRFDTVDTRFDNNTTILGDILYTEIPKGVSFLKGRSKPYMVRVTTKGITKLIGYYTTAKEAEQAYLSYKQSLKQ